MNRYPPHLAKIMEFFKKLPGVGSKSAERYAFNMIDWQPDELARFAGALASAKELLQSCAECGCLTQQQACPFCDLRTRSAETLCVVAHFKDVYAIEHTHEYKGLYHVLGSLLSPLEGKSPEKLNISKLKQRVIESGVREVVIAIDSTLEGDATTLYLKRELEDLDIQVSRLALGMPMGSSLDFVDGGTLARALSGRRGF
jgi:recombination protein RecR